MMGLGRKECYPDIGLGEHRISFTCLEVGVLLLYSLGYITETSCEQGIKTEKIIG